MNANKLTLKQCREILAALTSPKPDAEVSRLAVRWRAAVLRAVKAGLCGVPYRQTHRMKLVAVPRD